MGSYMDRAMQERMRGPIAWCERTARKWSIPYTWSFRPQYGVFCFGPCDTTLVEKVRSMSRAIWGKDMTRGYMSKIGTPCLALDLTKDEPRERGEWDWETLANV